MISHVLRAKLLSLAVISFVWLACTDIAPDSPTGPSFQPQFSAANRQDIERARLAQERHTAALMNIPGVVGTAVGLLPNGNAAVRILLAQSNVPGIPDQLDGVPVARTVTGMLVAFSDPTKRQRPAPLGFSVGHPSITAGTIGARVKNGGGQVFILSNNHVLANSNNAALGDAALQPGPFDGGTLANDQVGALFAFKPINFSGGSNTIDAAIALTTANETDNTTPADDGYGMPSATIFGDANQDGVFDDKTALLGLAVKKYGRTTKLTQGQITGINATLTICYEVLIIFCVKPATFVDQLIIEPGAFSGGGDSGSLIVTNPGLQPVGLLFAGSTAQTIANRIDLVLNHFGVQIDAGVTPPPTPITDIAVTDVSAPVSTEQGNTVNVAVTVRNVGNQAVTSAFDVTLTDQTDGVPIGAQSVAGLAVGATATRTFAWNTTGESTGGHTLLASHGFSDDNANNNTRTASVTVNAPGSGSGVHVGDLDGTASNDGRTWSAIVEVAVHNGNHQVVNGATVIGIWSPSGLASTECITGELGGNGTCIFLFPSIGKKTTSVTFTVTSVTMAGQTYQTGSNHDVDGSSNGNFVRVIKP